VGNIRLGASTETRKVDCDDPVPTRQGIERRAPCRERLAVSVEQQQGRVSRAGPHRPHQDSPGVQPLRLMGWTLPGPIEQDPEQREKRYDHPPGDQPELHSPKTINTPPPLVISPRSGKAPLAPNPHQLPIPESTAMYCLPSAPAKAMGLPTIPDGHL